MAIDESSLEKVRRLARDSKPVAALFKWFVDSDELEEETEARQIEEDRLPDLNVRWLDVLRSLEEAGAGEVIVGRHGRQTRFRWKGSVLELAERALEQPSRRTSPKASSRGEADDHVFPLRRDFSVSLRLPADVSREELDRLASFIRLLPSQD